MRRCEKYMWFVFSWVLLLVRVKIPLDGNPTILGSDGAAVAAAFDGFIRFALEGGSDLDLLPLLILLDGLGVLVCLLSLFLLDVGVILDGFSVFCFICFFGMVLIFQCFPLCTASS